VVSANDPVWNERLKTLRKGAGLRQEDVAAHLGMGRTTYLYIEAGVRSPDADELVKLAALYKVSVEEMFAMPISRDPLPDAPRSWLSVSGDEARLIELVRGGDLRGALGCLLEIVQE